MFSLKNFNDKNINLLQEIYMVWVLMLRLWNPHWDFRMSRSSKKKTTINFNDKIKDDALRKESYSINITPSNQLIAMVKTKLKEFHCFFYQILGYTKLVRLQYLIWSIYKGMDFLLIQLVNLFIVTCWTLKTNSDKYHAHVFGLHLGHKDSSSIKSLCEW